MIDPEYIEEMEEEMSGDEEEDVDVRKKRMIAVNMFARLVARKVVELMMHGVPPPMMSGGGPMPSGVMPSGVMPSGEVPSGVMPSGEVPSGVMPSGDIRLEHSSEEVEEHFTSGEFGSEEFVSGEFEAGVTASGAVILD